MDIQKYSTQCTDEEYKKFVPFIEQLLELANKEILPRFLSGINVEEKEDHSPVTAADKMAEKAMRELIDETYPLHGVYGEEYGVTEAHGDLPRYRWILDPVDGTRSFITNGFQFGTLIALERDGGQGFKPMIGVISHPQVGAWLIGRAEGTELYRSNKEAPTKVHVRNITDLSQATLLTTSHWTTPEQNGGRRMQDLIDQVKLYRTWGDCFGYFAVATGGADIMIDPSLHYWDIAAIVPIIEGAGGVVVSTQGGNPLTDLSAVAANPILAKEALIVLDPKLRSMLSI
ncbi:MAG: inositol monophosphatase [Burkholderiales bacterium]|nr:inositol monophosphatase [Burkholderiales bacterium]